MQKYKWKFLGLSTEIKPIEGENVTDGSTFYEVDTSTEYIYYKGMWYKQTTPSTSLNIVEITDMTGILTDEEFAKITSENCVLKASTQYFTKQYQASGVIRYGAIPRIGNDKIIFDYIDIDRNTKAYELKNETFQK